MNIIAPFVSSSALPLPFLNHVNNPEKKNIIRWAQIFNSNDVDLEWQVSSIVKINKKDKLPGIFPSDQSFQDKNIFHQPLSDLELFSTVY